MSKKKKNHKKNYRKDYPKAKNTSQDNTVLRVSLAKKGALEECISKYPCWVECDLTKPYDAIVPQEKIQFPIAGNHFAVQIVQDSESVTDAFTDVLAELNRKFSLRLLYCFSMEMYFFATDASYETVDTLFEYILSKRGIHAECCIKH